MLCVDIHLTASALSTLYVPNPASGSRPPRGSSTLSGCGSVWMAVCAVPDAAVSLACEFQRT